MILRNEGIHQYVTCGGEQLEQKVNKACGKPNALGERGMPQHVTGNKQICATKLLYSEICSSLM